MPPISCKITFTLVIFTLVIISCHQEEVEKPAELNTCLLTSIKIYAAGQFLPFETYKYDSEHRLIGATFSDLIWEDDTLTYNDHGQLINWTSPLDGTHTFTYNASGWLEQVQTSQFNGQPWIFSYSNDRLTTVKIGTTEQYALFYTGEGNVERVIYTNNVGTEIVGTYTYDNKHLNPFAETLHNLDAAWFALALGSRTLFKYSAFSGQHMPSKVSVDGDTLYYQVISGQNGLPVNINTFTRADSSDITRRQYGYSCY